MRLGDRVLALAALLAQPLRAVLTVLGIVVGSGSIVLVAGVVSGAEKALLRSAQNATGSDLVEVWRKEQPPRERARGRPELSRADARALSESFAGRNRRVHAEASHETRARFRNRDKRVRIVSGSPVTLSLFRLELARGRFLGSSDLAERRRVCVVGDELWQELFAGASLDDEPRLIAGGQSFLVVGVLRKKPLIGSTDGTRIWDRKAIVPETTYDLLHAPEHGADRILLQPAGDGPVPPLELTRGFVRSTLRRLHHGADNVELDDAAAREQERVILAIVQLLLIAIGALALVVGAINVANVMLVSVTERTREIGLRRALGATRASIVGQFLLESTVLALAGGIVGVAAGSALVGISGALLSRAFGQFSASVEPWAIALGLALALLSGIAAGVGPALGAASQNPVDALRTE